MHRIDTATAEPDLFGAGKDGFRDGSPPGTGSTRLDAAWFNAVQEELANAIESVGAALPSSSDNTLLKTLRLFSLVQTFSDGSDVDLDGGTLSIRAFTRTPNFNSGRIIAVGTAGEIQTSPEDGATWTHRTQAAAYAGTFNAAANDGTSLYLAVGSAGELQTSPDGITWTHQTAAASYAGNFMSAAWGASTFVAVGDTGEIQSSADGITWTHRTPASAYASLFASVVFAESLFVAVGESGEIQTSPDGVTWTRRRTGGAVGDWHRVAYGDGIFVAVSETSYIATSPDGITWTDSASAVAPGDGPILYLGGGLWLLLGPSAALSIDPRSGWVSLGNGLVGEEPNDALVTSNILGTYRLITCVDSSTSLRVSQRFTVV
jgi:hypothetical protein